MQKIIDAVIDYLTNNNISEDIIFKVKAIMLYPSGSIRGEVGRYLREQNVNKIIRLNIDDLFVRYEEGDEYTI